MENEGMSLVERFASAAEAAIGRCEQIIARSEEKTGRLSEFFAGGELAETQKVCLDFLEALAALDDIDDIKSIGSVLERLKERTFAANACVSARVQENPLMMMGLESCLETLFRLLLVGDPAVRIGARVLVGLSDVVRSVLTGVFTDLGHQLEVYEGVRLGRFAQAHSVLCQSFEERFSAPLIAAIAKLAEETKRELRMTRREMIRAYHSGDDVLGELSGPRNVEKRDQVRAVIERLATSSRKLAISEACRETYVRVPNGYATVHDLYVWCHRNEEKVRRMVDEYRLQNGEMRTWGR